MPTARRTRAARTDTKRVSYKESSSDECDAPPSKRIKAPHSSSKRKTSKSSPISASTKPKAPVQPSDPLPSDGVAPAWSSLPYAILFVVLQYAAYPLRDNSLCPTAYIAWLVGAARTCKTFRDPALAVLYENPPLFQLHQPHKLLSLLIRDRGSWSFNYQAAIKCLELDVRNTIAYRLPGRGLVDLSALVRQLPQLSRVNITDPLDRPPYRLSVPGPIWSYPSTLFGALLENETRLRGWRWNSRMLPKVPHLRSSEKTGENPLNLLHVHASPPFATLESLTLSHFSLHAGNLNQDLLPTWKIPLKHLEPLNRLCNLSLENCRFCDRSCLQDLPMDLYRLSVMHCQYFDSEIAESYLTSRGSQLTVLELSHNQDLGLSFLKSLATSCPKLEVLKMDLTFFSTLKLVGDTEPHFDTLIGTTETPTWPSSLERIELYHLRKWGPGTAETFFWSLVDSALDLPFLRHLIVKASLNIGWRDRALFRDTWTSRLEHVFQRRSTPPATHLVSIKAFRLWKKAQSEEEDNTGFANQMDVPALGSHILSSSSARRSQRIQMNATRLVTAAHPANVDRAPGMKDPRGQGSAEGEVHHFHIQGLCEMVDVVFDNLRPVEFKRSEDDFL